MSEEKRAQSEKKKEKPWLLDEDQMHTVQLGERPRKKNKGTNSEESSSKEE